MERELWDGAVWWWYELGTRWWQVVFMSHWRQVAGATL
ncbi:hypothetical protein Btus_0931 [Kyrpidia tusciae DSM 2912]|uniref:Uncharacterized protein n=1 Tax=Kyrpidia tusciae (strain DSM 2912 / NBRC 15312 / T2) TaxID=562970 RepID=D5WW39_KYRT2|nr:hypothetical protein Btus_0931 [Kyrpidia tusciae DSM 2912]